MEKRVYGYLSISVLLLGLVGGCYTGTTAKQTVVPTTSPMSSCNTEQEKKDSFIDILQQANEIKKIDYNAFHRMLSREIGSRTSLFCIDEDTGISYFVNQGKDYYLYQLKDGKAELLVQMPVKELFAYDGLVYFMIESYGVYELTELREGDIYCYSSWNNSVELVHEAGLIEGAKNYKLKVDTGGIYFSYSIENSETSASDYYYHLPFDDTKRMTEEGWGNYHFSYMPELVLVSRTEGLADVRNLSMNPFRYCVVGDNLYSVELGSMMLSCLNLKTEERIEYDFSKAVQQVHKQLEIGELSEDTVILQSFIVTEKEIWVAGTRELYHMDLTSGEVNWYKLIDEKGNQCEITALYTDKEHLYGAVKKTEDANAIVVQILTNQISQEEIGSLVMQIEDVVKE